ncbi:MAG: CotH kinase family protein [Candidatus Electryonea clarkiae]|nr:CotH kinase family protein [Candidatus Electryonea clarkiae]
MQKYLRNMLHKPTHPKNSLIALTGILVSGILIAANAYSLELRTYRVTCDAGEFEYIIENWEENQYINCIFEYDGQTWNNARLRLRGDTSRRDPKKSFKINFDGDERFEDNGIVRDKINLVSEFSDPSFSREFLAYDLFRRAGLPVANSVFARLYINDVYNGLYLDVEQIDVHFLRGSDFDNDASVFKADRDGCFLDTSDVIAEFWTKEEPSDDDFAELESLIQWLSETTDSQFLAELSDYFDPVELARIMVVNSILANGSTYYHNYFLVHDTAGDGLWHMLPWDMDKTFIYWHYFEQWPYYRCSHQLYEKSNVLISRCWQDTGMFELVIQQFDGIVDSLFTAEYYESMTDSIAILLADAVEEDQQKQYSLEEFQTTLDELPGKTIGRVDKMREQFLSWPRPFDFKPATVNEEGILFSWDPTFIEDGTAVTYKVNLAQDLETLYNSPQVISNITQPSLQVSGIYQSTYFFKVFAVVSSNRITESLRSYLVFEVPDDAIEGTAHYGSVSQNTVFYKNGNPHIIPEGLYVEPGINLTLEEGVELLIAPGKSIDIDGKLFAIGSQTDSVRISRLDPQRPWGVIWAQGEEAEVLFRFANISGGSDSISIDDAENNRLNAHMIQVWDASLNIYDSKLSDGIAGGIAAYSSDVHIERTEIRKFARDPDYAANNGTAYPEGLHIIRGTIILKDCLLTDGPPAGSVSMDYLDLNGTHDSEITGNKFIGSGDDAADIDASYYIRFSRNIIVDCDDNGLSIGSSSHHIYADNNIILRCGKAIGLKLNTEIELWNNYFADCGAGVSVKQADEGCLVTMRNSIMINVEEPFEASEPSKVDFDIAYNFIDSDEPWPGNGNINGDPLLADPDNGDYSLLPGSPLIDAGFGSEFRIPDDERDTLAPRLTVHPTFDYNGTSRMDNLNVENTGGGDVPYVDIGLFEYQGEIPVPPGSGLFLYNSPNPFNGFTYITFPVLSGSWAKIEIFNVLGKRVFKLKLEGSRLERYKLNEDQYAYPWDVANSGSYLASGMYFCRVSQQSGTKFGKMVLIWEPE